MGFQVQYEQREGIGQMAWIESDKEVISGELRIVECQPYCEGL